jgi:hypothetical protein
MVVCTEKLQNATKKGRDKNKDFIKKIKGKNDNKTH